MFKRKEELGQGKWERKEVKRKKVINKNDKMETKLYIQEEDRWKGGEGLSKNLKIYHVWVQIPHYHAYSKSTNIYIYTYTHIYMYLHDT